MVLLRASLFHALIISIFVYVSYLKCLKQLNDKNVERKKTSSLGIYFIKSAFIDIFISLNL